jgi:hypothetical protein
MASQISGDQHERTSLSHVPPPTAPSRVEDAEDIAVRPLFDTHLHGTVRTSKAVRPASARPAGTIVNHSYHRDPISPEAAEVGPWPPLIPTMSAGSSSNGECIRCRRRRRPERRASRRAADSGEGVARLADRRLRRCGARFRHSHKYKRFTVEILTTGHDRRYYTTQYGYRSTGRWSWASLDAGNSHGLYSRIFTRYADSRTVHIGQYAGIIGDDKSRGSDRALSGT